MNQVAAQQPRQAGTEVAISGARLPYPKGVEERFGVDRAGWRALVDAVFPAAKTPDSIILALSYCKARKLDPFKRVVHIVPVWDSQQKRMVETVWPGIAELRTTAFRTGDYAGREPSEFGPVVKQKVGNVVIEFPEWAQVTVYRMVKGQRCPFPGPRIYWLEAYAQAKRDDASPNSMWAKRTRGQLDKCAEAAALRAAFPEEIGGDLSADEAEAMGYRGPDFARDVTPAADAPPRPKREDFAEAAEPDIRRLDNEYRQAMGEVVTDDPADEPTDHDPETGEVTTTAAEPEPQTKPEPYVLHDRNGRPIQGRAEFDGPAEAMKALAAYLGKVAPEHRTATYDANVAAVNRAFETEDDAVQAACNAVMALVPTDGR